MKRSALLAVLPGLVCPLALVAQAPAAIDSLAKAANVAAAANTVAINFVWTLVTGFLVMFMQAGFAMVETGFTRAKNAAHTFAMNFMVYGLGIRDPGGRRGPHDNPRRLRQAERGVRPAPGR